MDCRSDPDRNMLVCPRVKRVSFRAAAQTACDPTRKCWAAAWGLYCTFCRGAPGASPRASPGDPRPSRAAVPGHGSHVWDGYRQNRHPVTKMRSPRAEWQSHGQHETLYKCTVIFLLKGKLQLSASSVKLMTSSFQTNPLL